MGLPQLITALSAVIIENPEARLLMAGTGPLRKELEELIERQNLQDKVELLGFVEEERLPLYYAAADLFVLPTQQLEGFGIATIEALSTGTPALGTPIGATVEILGKLDKDLLFENPSSEAMAQKINQYLKKENLEPLRTRCREFVVENYAFEKIARQLEKEILELCD